MEKNNKLNIIRFFMIFIIVIIVIIMSIIFNMKSKQDNEEIIVPDSNISNEVEEINENNSSGSFNTTTEEIRYIELNEENYEKYNSKIVKISNNNNGTYTIIARVYEEVILPTLSKNEVEVLESGNTIKILDWTFKKDTSENYESTNNLELISSADEEMKFYVTQNNDGTASLSYYGEMILGKPTQTYMRTIVTKQVFADEEISEYFSDETNSSRYAVLVYSEEIQFENGKISFFDWTGN